MVPLEALTQLRAETSEIISSTIASWGRLSSPVPRPRRPRAGERRQPLGTQEEFPWSAATDRVRRAAPAAAYRPLGRRSSRAGHSPPVPPAAGARRPLRVHAKSAPRQSGVAPPGRGIQTVAPSAPLRDDPRVALLPVADRRRRNVQHAGHRTNAVDAAPRPSFIRHGSHGSHASRSRRGPGERMESI